jgi:predicted O-methyltransferase YrrM
LSRLFGFDRREIQEFVDDAAQVSLPSQQNTDREIVPLGGGMSREDRTTLYTLVRAAKPETVIETGTADGVSATFILAAFEKNQRGFLYSVDYGDDQERIGQLIPAAYRNRLKLLHGDSLEILRGALKDTHVDLFLHDSNHTYSHMTAEFNWAVEHMPEGGVICSHDVLFSNAWKHFLSAQRIKKHGVIMNFGLCRVEV